MITVRGPFSISCSSSWPSLAEGPAFRHGNKHALQTSDAKAVHARDLASANF